jgi:hypothetical protein
VVVLEVQCAPTLASNLRRPQPLPASHQLHARIEHWRVVVITPHRRFNLGFFTLPADLRAWFDDHSAD